jgi:hypothetical protein
MTGSAAFLVPTASALRASWLATTLFMSLICACGGSEITSASACAPGRSISCTGVGPCAGSQTCKEDGSGYDPCVCSANGGGGSPNNGADASALDDSASGARDGAATGHDSATDSRSDARGSDGSGSYDSGDAGCLSWALGGIGIPAGTLATASATYSNDVAADAIDRDLSTCWNAPGYTASLSLTFPMPQSITGIRMAANSSPAASETYTVTPVGSSTMIGSATETVNGNTSVDGGPPYTIEPAIPVTPGSYAGITINVDGVASWVAINEISLLTSECP